MKLIVRFQGVNGGAVYDGTQWSEPDEITPPFAELHLSERRASEILQTREIVEGIHTRLKVPATIYIGIPATGGTMVRGTWPDPFDFVGSINALYMSGFKSFWLLLPDMMICK